MNEAYLKQKRILLVDDEQALLDLVVSILQMDGYQRIRTAGTVRTPYWRRRNFSRSSRCSM